MNLRFNSNAIVTNSKGEILLVRLKKGPFAGGLCIPGGGIDPGELSHDAINREVLEETGIQIKNQFYPIGYCELIHDGVKDHRIVLLFHSTSDEIPRDTEEGEAMWMKYEEMGEKLIPFARESIKMWKEGRNYFKLIGGRDWSDEELEDLANLFSERI